LQRDLRLIRACQSRFWGRFKPSTKAPQGIVTLHRNGRRTALTEERSAHDTTHEGRSVLTEKEESQGKEERALLGNRKSNKKRRDGLDKYQVWPAWLTFKLFK